MQCVDNYVFTKKLDLDLIQQQEAADIMYHLILNKFQANGKDYNGQSTMTTKLFSQYNYLMYPVPGISTLYKNIVDFFYECLENDKTSMIYDEYHMQCWLNYYRNGDFIDWHSHYPEQYDSWHGFYCVDVEPNSSTLYKLKDKSDIIEVVSEDNLLVLSKSAGDLHRTTEWQHDRPRITIAFDIVPSHMLFSDNSFSMKNHWVPL